MTFTYFCDRKIIPLWDNTSCVGYYMVIICECLHECKTDAYMLRIIRTMCWRIQMCTWLQERIIKTLRSHTACYFYYTCWSHELPNSRQHLSWKWLSRAMCPLCIVPHTGERSTPWSQLIWSEGSQAISREFKGDYTCWTKLVLDGILHNLVRPCTHEFTVCAQTQTPTHAI